MLGKVQNYGSGGGIGSAVARILAQKGYDLHLTGRDERKP
jgi:short-subunit dehydrogenase